MEKHLIKQFISEQPNNLTEGRDQIHNRTSFRFNTSKNQLIKVLLFFFASIVITASVLVGGKLLYDKLKPWPTYIPSESLVYGQTPYNNETGIIESDLRLAYAPAEKYAPSIVNSLDGDVIYVYDPDSLQVYVSKNIDTKSHLASITKLVSVLVVREKYKLDDKVTFTGKYYSWENGLGVVAGDQMTVSDVLKVMLIASKNDVAEEMAEIYPDGGYDGFIKRMNEITAGLGMKNSSFDSASGLWEGENNYSTAADMRLLVDHILNDSVILDDASKLTDTVSIYKSNGSVVNKTLATTNFLLGNVAATKGLKTGYTVLAGQCFVGYFIFEDVNTANTGKRRLITIVLGSSDRFGDTERLVR